MCCRSSDAELRLGSGEKLLRSVNTKKVQSKQSLAVKSILECVFGILKRRNQTVLQHIHPCFISCRRLRYLHANIWLLQVTVFGTSAVAGVGETEDWRPRRGQKGEILLCVQFSHDVKQASFNCARLAINVLLSDLQKYHFSYNTAQVMMTLFIFLLLLHLIDHYSRAGHYSHVYTTTISSENFSYILAFWLESWEEMFKDATVFVIMQISLAWEEFLHMLISVPINVGFFLKFTCFVASLGLTTPLHGLFSQIFMFFCTFTPHWSVERRISACIA